MKSLTSFLHLLHKEHYKSNDSIFPILRREVGPPNLDFEIR